MNKNDLATTRMRGCALMWRKRTGEEHRYAELTHGLSCVLRDQGVIVTPIWLSSTFHDPLVEIDAHRTDVAQIVQAMEAIFRRTGKVELPYDYQERYSYDRGVAIETSGMSQQVLEHLKRQKIRRGTKAYKEWVTQATGIVLDAAQKAAEEAILAAERRQKQAEYEAAKKSAVINTDITRIAQQRDVIAALRRAAGLPKESEAVNRLNERIRLYQTAVDHTRSRIERGRRDLRSLDPQVIAIEGLRANEYLRPFLGEEP